MNADDVDGGVEPDFVKRVGSGGDWNGLQTVHQLEAEHAADAHQRSDMLAGLGLKGAPLAA